MSVSSIHYWFSPTLVSNYVAYLYVAHAEGKTKLDGVFSILVSLSYLSGLLKSEFIALLNAVCTSFCCMIDVHLIGTPLQIIRSIVGSNGVQVIDHRKAVGVRNKGCGNQSVDSYQTLLPITEEANMKISKLGHSRLYCLGFPSLSMATTSNTKNSALLGAYGPHIADLVVGVESDHVPPSLFHNTKIA